MSENLERAAEAIGCLLAHGVEEVVICAGARNAPLITPLLDLAAEGRIRAWRHFDERAASFFAMGMAKKNRKPVAVVTTSGTAAAELLPATVESYFSGVPLVLLTADRPARYRGSGAPQAIDQVRIFGDYAQFTESADDASDWTELWPLHFNLCLEEPVAESLDISTITVPEYESHALEPEPIELPEIPDAAVAVVGELPGDLQEETLRFLERMNLPAWCEATSGIRESRVPLLLDESSLAAYGAELVLRIGGVPSCRYWRDLEADEDIEVINLTPTGFSGLARESETFEIQPGMLDALGGQREMGAPVPAMKEKPFAEFPRSEPALIHSLSERIDPGALVFLGNSLPIRVWNSAATRDLPHARCFANRGANGIDGEVSTFLGLSQGEDEAWGIIGDLTSLYDLNAPWVAGQGRATKTRIVVVNNGGGRIFSRLPSMKGFTPDQKKVSENRHTMRFAAWAEMWGMAYHSWDGVDEFPDLQEDFVLLELLVDEGETEQYFASRSGS